MRYLPMKQLPLQNSESEMQINIDDVMARADFLYGTMCDAEGRRHDFSIRSNQVKALAQALVEEINAVLLILEPRS